MKRPKIPKLPTGRRLLVAVALVALLAAALWPIVRRVSPLPPRTLVMSTGVADGGYHRFGLRYQELLRANDVRLELLTSSGSLENLQRLHDGTVSVALVQGGTGALAPGSGNNAEPEEAPLRSLAAVFYEPVWIFSHSINLSKGLGLLAGKRIAVGVAGSGNHKVALDLLSAYGVVADAQDGASDRTTFVTEGGMAVVDLLKRRQVDAAIIIAAPQAPAVEKLLADGTMRLASLDHVEGLAQRFPYFQPVVLKRGAVDPRRNIPARHVNLLATTGNLVIRDELHPALAYLLLEAARDVHKQPSLVSRPGEFPNSAVTEFPLASEAERYFKDGRPFLQKFLPFWAANYVQRLILLLVPLAAIVIPLTRTLPQLWAWRSRRKLLRRYGELKYLERDLAQRQLSPSERSDARSQLDRIETEIASAKFPLDFADKVYTLRQHVDYVREQLNRQTTAPHEA